VDFTRQDEGIRAHFVLVDSKGVNITGAVAGDFVVTAVNPADDATNIPTVSELTSAPGLYTFLVPSSFLTTHGNGVYPIRVDVDKTTTPKVKDVISKPYRVHIRDFDTLSYNGSIHINTKTGSAGTLVGVNGTPENPVSNLADAVTLAAAIGVRKYNVIGNLTLTSSHDDWTFVGDANAAVIALNNQDVADSLFRNCELSGTILTGPIQAEGCDLDGVGNFTGHAHECGLVNGSDLGSGTSTFESCYSAVPGLSTPSLDLDDVASLNLRSYSGGIEIRNMSGAGQNASLEFIAGQAVLAATCTAGTITLRGVGNLTDNSAGTTVEKNSFINIDAIFSELVDGTIDFRTFCKYGLAMVAGEFTETIVSGTIRDFTFEDRAASTLYSLRITKDTGRTRLSG